MNNDWITDPQAIDTIVNLKALLPGDEIVLQGGQGRLWCYIPPEETDTVVIVQKVRSSFVGMLYDHDDKKTLIVASTVNPRKNDEWWICRHHIKAWRRPHG